jgi:hypothetical protein
MSGATTPKGKTNDCDSAIKDSKQTMTGEKVTTVRNDVNKNACVDAVFAQVGNDSGEVLRPKM